MLVVAVFIVIFIGLPVLSYLVVKFGTYGYFRAKQLSDRKEVDIQEKVE